MPFNKSAHLIKVQGGRSYLPVSARIVWFREQCPEWAVVTEPVEINHEKQFAVFRATVMNAEGRIMATATKKEDVKGFGDFIEKSETGAIGRALGLCGFGTDSDPDFSDGKDGEPSHIVDSPLPSSTYATGQGRYRPGAAR